MTMAGSFDNRQTPVGRLSSAESFVFKETGNGGLIPLTRTPIGALVQKTSAVLYPAICSVTASGQYRRPAAARSSASAAPPFGLWYPAVKGGFQNRMVYQYHIDYKSFMHSSLL
jgi:hypothetical protein